jgi:hypothetical protein
MSTEGERGTEDATMAKQGNTPRRISSWAEARVLLEDWHRRTTQAQFGHQMEAERTRTWTLSLGIPVVIFTTIVGTGSFAAINDSTTNTWKVAAGVISILAAILASVQTFLGFAERSDRHRIAAARYASTRRSIELALTSHDTDAVPLIKGEMDRMGGASPQISRRTWEVAHELAEGAIDAWRRGRADLERAPVKSATRRRERAGT